MEKYMEVMRLTIELSDSCLAGIRHLQNQLNMGYMEESIILLQDVVGAFYQMEKAIQPIIDILVLTELEDKTNLVRDSLEHVVTFYEKEEDGQAYSMIEMKFLPYYLDWKEDIERSFTSYVVT